MRPFLLYFPDLLFHFEFFPFQTADARSIGKRPESFVRDHSFDRGMTRIQSFDTGSVHAVSPFLRYPMAHRVATGVVS